MVPPTTHVESTTRTHPRMEVFAQTSNVVIVSWRSSDVSSRWPLSTAIFYIKSLMNISCDNALIAFKTLGFSGGLLRGSDNALRWAATHLDHAFSSPALFYVDSTYSARLLYLSSALEKLQGATLLPTFANPLKNRIQVDKFRHMSRKQVAW